LLVAAAATGPAAGTALNAADAAGEEEQPLTPVSNEEGTGYAKDDEVAPTPGYS
jgi:hypothetical protein